MRSTSMRDTEAGSLSTGHQDESVDESVDEFVQTDDESKRTERK
jgi:hypothetical protein